jgi:choline dehydrogenase
MFWVSDPTGDPPSYSLEVVLMKPRSRGSVRLRSADPVDPPVVDLPGLRDPADVERLAEAYQRGLEVADRPEIRGLCSGPRPPDPGDREALRTFIREHRYLLPHVVGTCAMGTSPHDGAVVDASGGVHGVERLSVVDASIMPDLHRASRIKSRS